MEYSCVSLEDKLGLNRGDIQQIEIDGDGVVRISLKETVPIEAKLKLRVMFGEKSVTLTENEQLAVDAEQATCEEYLAHSSDVITQPEIWYLLRVFGKKLGYKVD